ncbi:MAG: YbhB/YbcL family Raf kinase inhibitor-like protein, partial [Candidatus Saccharibacteria bacterium]
VHWVAVNIPPNAKGIPEGASGTGKMPIGTLELMNSFGEKGYGGPGPPPGSGVHKYKIILVALNSSSLKVSKKPSYSEFVRATAGKTLAKSELVCTYSQ